MEIAERFRNATVLIVDDEPDIRQEILWRFDNEGFSRLREAGSGNEALALHESAPADLVITDIRMADGTGVDLIRELRRNPDHTLPVILAMTAYSDLSPQEAYLRQVDALFQKPFPLGQLVSAGVHFLTLRSAIAHNAHEQQALSCLDEISELLMACTLRLQRLSLGMRNEEKPIRPPAHQLEQVLSLHRRMQRFLADFRIRHQSHDPEGASTFSLADLVQNVVTVWKSQFDDPEAEFDFDAPASLLHPCTAPGVRGQAALLGHGIHAIIEQALAECSSAPKVRVLLSWEGTRIVLTCEAPHSAGAFPSLERQRHSLLTDSLIQRIAVLHGGSYGKQIMGELQVLTLELPIASPCGQAAP